MLNLIVTLGKHHFEEVPFRRCPLLEELDNNSWEMLSRRNTFLAITVPLLEELNNSSGSVALRRYPLDDDAVLSSQNLENYLQMYCSLGNDVVIPLGRLKIYS